MLFQETKNLNEKLLQSRAMIRSSSKGSSQEAVS
jgi:hypothetical protein